MVLIEKFMHKAIIDRRAKVILVLPIIFILFLRGLCTAGDYSYYVPYFKSQLNYWTAIGLKNGNHQIEANVQITIFSSDGNVQGRDESMIPARGQNSFVVGTGLTEEGWLKIDSDQPLTGLCFTGTSGYASYMADIPFSSECSDLLELPHVAQGPVYDTSVMVCNPSNSQTSVKLVFVNNDGESLYEASKILPANGSWKYNLSELVSDSNESNKGSVEISATQPVAAFGLYNSLKSGGFSYAGINAVIPEMATADPDSPKAINLDISPDQIVANGNDSATLTATVVPYDQRGGQIADGTILEFQIISGRASLSSDKSPTFNGETSVSIVSQVAGPVTVKATVQGTRVSKTIDLNALAGFDGLFKKIGSKSVVKINGYYQSGSIFNCTIQNLSKRTFEIYRAEYKNGNEIYSYTTDKSLLSGGQLSSQESVGLKLTLNKNIKDNGLKCLYFMRNPSTGTGFQVEYQFEDNDDWPFGGGIEWPFPMF